MPEPQIDSAKFRKVSLDIFVGSKDTMFGSLGKSTKMTFKPSGVVSLC